MDSHTQSIIEKYTHGEIRQLLEKAGNAYHNGRNSTLTDAQYDYLSQYLAEDMKIGAMPMTNDAVKVTLPVHMGSMDKIKSDSNALASFLHDYRHSMCISEKLDGISLLIDASRRPIRAYTRGNGDIGQDVSHILPYIRGVPTFKTMTLDGYVRGEAIISRQQWTKISHKGKNARNYVAGIINSKEPNKDDIRCIEFTAYEYIPSPVPNEIMSPSVQFKYLSKCGFSVVRHMVVPHKKVNNQTMLALLDEWKHSSAFEIDGIIIANDAGYSIVSQGNPKHAKAFKHNVIENAAETTVTGVEWNISKDGKWKPVVLVESVELEGVTVQRASGYNARFIQENGIGKGAVVRILRSGGVIPKIVEIVEKSDQVVLPSESTWDENGTELIVASSSSSGVLRSSKKASCSNIPQTVNSNDMQEERKLSTQQSIDAKKLEHFVTQCGIEFYKEKMIHRGIFAGVITNYHDLLNAGVKEFMLLEGVKDKMAEKIYESVQTKINEIELHVFASALSIFPNIGMKKLKELFAFENGIVIRSYQENISNNRAFQGSFEITIGAVDGFSDKSTKAIVDNIDILFIELQYIIDKYPSSKIARMLKAYIENKPQSKPSSPRNSVSEAQESQEAINRVNGRTIVFTGYRDKPLEERLERMGARIGTRIRQNSILVTKDTRKQTTKVREAQELNCPIYLPEEFMAFVFGNGN